MAVITAYGDLATKVQAGGTNANMFLPAQKGRFTFMEDAKTVATTSLDDIGDITIFLALPSNAVIRSLKIFNDDLDTGTSTLRFTVGLFYLTGNTVGSTLKTAGTEMPTANAIVSTPNSAISALNRTGIELMWGDLALVANKDKHLWELGGLTADCGGYIGIGLKISTVANTATQGDVLVQCMYQED